MTSLHQMAATMLAESKLWTDPDLPLQATAYPGQPRVLLVAGENVSGKSFFVECLRSWAKRWHKTDSISISIRERTGAGTYEMAAFRRTMMFGDESEHSTGATSAKVVQTGFYNANSWAADQKIPLLVLDEPELGLSEGYACAMGTFIAEEVHKLHPQAAGVVVVSHSRGLGRALAAGLGAAPSFVKLGEPLPFATWLEQVEQHNVEALLALGTTDRERWRAINKVVSDHRPQRT